MRWTAAILCPLAIVVVLAFPVVARASHGGGYWFHQGYLPKADGTRTVLHKSICCPRVNVVRMSWQPGTHSMNFVFVAYNGRWEFYESWAWDYTVGFFVGSWRATDSAGCQNPPRPGYYAVWTNCRVGLS